MLQKRANELNDDYQYESSENEESFHNGVIRVTAKENSKIKE